ncbi:MAG TPA: hypothetical protein VGF30_07960, partial [Bacteroidia bacterium]
MNKKLLTLLILSFVLTVNAQTYFYQGMSFAKTPTVYKPADAEKNQDIITVLDKNIYEVAYDSDGQAAIYETVHTIYHVNSAKGVDEVNKVYIPLRNVNEEIDVKARCITDENKVIYFNK